MTSLRHALTIPLLLATFAGTPATAKPEQIAGDAVPEKAVCRVCEVRGSQHGAEHVAAAREHDGTAYYFCSTGCAEAFDGFPAGYVVMPVPRPAPSLSMTTLAGADVSLARAEGPVLVDFWATWCKPCIEAMPELSELHETYGPRGLTVLGVSIDEKGPEQVASFLEEREVSYPIAVDGGDHPAWFAWGVAAIPAAFLVHDGQIVAEWRGRIDPAVVEAAVTEVLPEGR